MSRTYRRLKKSSCIFWTNITWSEWYEGSFDYTKNSKFNSHTQYISADGRFNEKRHKHFKHQSRRMMRTHENKNIIQCFKILDYEDIDFPDTTGRIQGLIWDFY